MATTVPQLTTGILGSAALPESSSQSEQTGRKNSMDMNSFLTMFTTQLRYQDPTNPMQSHELAAQLAQFSTVERLSVVNSTLKEMQSYLYSLNNAQMVGLVGKEVTGLANAVRVQAGSASSLNYKLETPADATVRVYDEANNLVRVVNMGIQQAGSHEFKWDGRNAAGTQLADGNYSCKVEAVEPTGRVSDVSVTTHGSVYAWRMQDGVPYLVLNGPDGVKLSLGQITEVTAQGPGA